ncbi:hypothetical protein TNCV_4274681 [Trichonephila clavipes]|nr:hypothetical protein TNCV_4274681 [Trichonephila clavipes]
MDTATLDSIPATANAAKRDLYRMDMVDARSGWNFGVFCLKVLLQLWERLSLEIRVRTLFILHLITQNSWSWPICLVQYNFSDWSRGRSSVTPPQNVCVY